MWEDYRINGADFNAGEDVKQPEMREQQLRKEAEMSCSRLLIHCLVRRAGIGE
jgi:hypothetical protein